MRCSYPSVSASLWDAVCIVAEVLKVYKSTHPMLCLKNVKGDFFSSLNTLYTGDKQGATNKKFVVLFH